MQVIDLGLEVLDFLMKLEDGLPNVLGIQLVVVCELRDHHVVGVESMFHHPLALENLLLATNYLITKLSVTYNFRLAENTLLKTAYHFFLLLVGFDTLTYRMDYDRSSILVGHQALPLATAKLRGGAPVSYHHHTPIFTVLLSLTLLVIS